MSWFPQSPVTPDCPAAALEASLRAAAPGQPGGGGRRRLELLQTYKGIRSNWSENTDNKMK